MSAILLATKPIWLPALTALFGWLLPSPIQAVAQKVAQVAIDEATADKPDQDVTNLDNPQ